MRTLSMTSLFLLLAAPAFAESENPPVATPTPSPAATSDATPASSPSPAANATPTPSPVASPDATPAPSPAATPITTPPAAIATPTPAPATSGIAAPAWAASTPAVGRPAREPRGWEVEAVLHSQGVFDRGVHVFAEGSYLPGAEVRVRKTLSDSMSRFSASPELSYGVAHATRLYPRSASTELWLQRFQAGARGSMALDRVRGLRPVARVGATGLWGTALAHDSYRDHREEAYGFGAYLAGGLEVDLGNVFTVLEPQQRMTFGLEAGHLYTGGLAFGAMGTLDVNGLFYSAQVGLRF